MPHVSNIATSMSSASQRRVAILGNASTAIIGLNGNMPTKIPPEARRRHSPLFLKEWIEFRHMTAEQFAGRIGTNKSVISRLINGKQRYHQDWLEIIVFYLDCEVPDLFRHPESPSADSMLRRMTPAQRSLALKAIEDISRWGPPPDSDMAA